MFNNAALQDDQWLACLPPTLGFDDLEIYFEDISDVTVSVRSANSNHALVNGLENNPGAGA